MAFTIPNLADAGFPDQAEPDKVDIDIIVAALNRTGVVSGCAVTAQGTPDMTVAVASGTIAVAGAEVAVTSGNVTITTAHATNPRIDLVVVNNSGTKSVTAGTAAADPVMPAIPANSVVLAAVYVPANDTAINSNQITDKRMMIYNLAAAYQALSEKGAASGYASLSAGTKVVEDPANATATPTASKIPIADGSGKLDGWITAGAQVAQGSYTGNDADNRTISLAFTPKFVVVTNETDGNHYAFSPLNTATMGARIAGTPSTTTEDGASAAAADRPSLTTNGFIVSHTGGASASFTMNENTKVFHYFAIG